MPGLVQGKVTGGNLHLDATAGIATIAVAAGANPTKAEYDTLVAAFNALVTMLAANGAAKKA